jgi:outer membrane protein assembly factor BamB
MHFRHHLFVIWIGLSVTIFPVLAAQGQTRPIVERCWTHDLENTPTPLLVAGFENLYFASAGMVRAVDPGTGERLWSAELGGTVNDIAFAEHRVFAVTNPIDNYRGSRLAILRSLNASTGLVEWSQTLAFSERFYLLAASPSGIVVADAEGRLYAFEKGSGKEIWNTALPGPLTARPTAEGVLITAVFGEGEVAVISSEDGSLRTRTALKNPVTSLLLNGEDVFAGDGRGTLSFISGESGRINWEFRSGGGITHISTLRDGILATSRDNFIYFLSRSSGNVVWKRRLPARVIEGGLLVNDMVFALVYGEDLAYLIDGRKGSVIEQVAQTEKAVSARIPVLVGSKGIAFTTSKGIEFYSLSGCGAKLREAATLAAPRRS